MPSPRTQYPNLRTLLREVAQWGLTDRMRPSTLFQAQENVARIRRDVIPTLPFYRRPGFELVLRGCQRDIDKSIKNLVKKFRHAPPSTFGVSVQSSPEVWLALQQWTAPTLDLQGEYELAHQFRMDVLQERLSHNTDPKVILDLYARLLHLHTVVPTPKGQPINPYEDWMNVCREDGMGIFKHQANAWQDLQKLGDQLHLPQAHQSNVLAQVVQRIGSSDPAVSKRHENLADIVLRSGVDWNKALRTTLEPGEEYIRSHPAYQRHELNNIATRGKVVSSAPSARPAF